MQTPTAPPSPRLTVVGFDVANDPAAQRQLTRIAEAGGGRLIEATDVASLTNAVRVGVSGAPWGGWSGGGGRRPDNMSGGDWAVLIVVLLNVTMLCGLLALGLRRRPRMAVPRPPRSRRARRIGWFVALLTVAQGGTASLESTTRPFVAVQPGAAPRGPVLFVHGYNGDEGTFATLASSLQHRGWVDLPPLEIDGTQSSRWVADAQRVLRQRSSVDPDRVSLRVVFGNARTLPLEQQARYVGEAQALLRQVTGATRVRLVGHSMGGLAARAWVQGTWYDGAASELITVATPHLGSLWPYIEASAPRVPWSCGVVFNALRGVAGVVTPFGAEREGLERLGPLSEEIAAINEPRVGFTTPPAHIRYVNVVASTTEDWRCLGYAQTQLGEHYALLRARWEREFGSVGNPDDLLYFASPGLLIAHSDLIVPVVSQSMRLVPAARGIPLEEAVIDAHHMSATAAPTLVPLLDDRVVAPPTPVAGAEEVLLLLDLSESMAERNKLPMAQQALHAVADGLSPASSVTLIEFGRRVCSIEEHRLGTDRAALRSRIDGMTATGATPLLLAMQEAAASVRRLPRPERAVVVVVSDGVDTCTRGGDPAAVARELGIALHIIRG